MSTFWLAVIKTGIVDILHHRMSELQIDEQQTQKTSNNYSRKPMPVQVTIKLCGNTWCLKMSLATWKAVEIIFYSNDWRTWILVFCIILRQIINVCDKVVPSETRSSLLFVTSIQFISGPCLSKPPPKTRHKRLWHMCLQALWLGPFRRTLVPAPHGQLRT